MKQPVVEIGRDKVPSLAPRCVHGSYQICRWSCFTEWKRKYSTHYWRNPSRRPIRDGTPCFTNSGATATNTPLYTPGPQYVRYLTRNRNCGETKTGWHWLGRWTAMFVSVSSKFFFLIAQAIEAATFFGSFFFLDSRPPFTVVSIPMGPSHGPRAYRLNFNLCSGSTRRFLFSRKLLYLR